MAHYKGQLTLGWNVTILIILSAPTRTLLSEPDMSSDYDGTAVCCVCSLSWLSHQQLMGHCFIQMSTPQKVNWRPDTVMRAVLTSCTLQRCSQRSQESMDLLKNHWLHRLCEKQAKLYGCSWSELATRNKRYWLAVLSLCVLMASTPICFFKIIFKNSIKIRRKIIATTVIINNIFWLKTIMCQLLWCLS